MSLLANLDLLSVPENTPTGLSKLASKYVAAFIFCPKIPSKVPKNPKGNFWSIPKLDFQTWGNL